MATGTDTVLDPETMSMDALRKAAEEEARKVSTTTTTEEVKVDEEKETPKVFEAQRTIDLGEGSGKQVFKGHGPTREAALEELTDKLTEAQRNATRKIRELAATAKPKTEKKSTPEEEAIISQELMKAPTETVKKIIKSVADVDVEDIREAARFAKEQRALSARKAAADEFVASNPDFQDTPRNGKLINKWCELHNDFSLEGLTKAYQDLSESGLLDVKGEEARVEQVEEKDAKQRIVARSEVKPSQSTRKASGLSTQTRSAATPIEPTEEDMYTMPLDKLKQLANKQLGAR